MRLQVVLAGKKPSYYDLEGAAEEKLLEHYGGSGENTVSGLVRVRVRVRVSD